MAWKFVDKNIGGTFKSTLRVKVISRTSEGYEVCDADDPEGTWIICPNEFAHKFKKVKNCD